MFVDSSFRGRSSHSQGFNVCGSKNPGGNLTTPHKLVFKLPRKYINVGWVHHSVMFEGNVEPKADL